MRSRSLINRRSISSLNPHQAIKTSKQMFIAAFCLQSMVKIKYNNMKSTKNHTTPQQQPIKRKLRSSTKQSPQDCPGTGPSSDQKTIQEIQKQFDNQQSINGSKSTGPIQDELKAGVYESALSCMRTRRTRYDDLLKYKPEDIVREMVTKETLEEVMPVDQGPVAEEVVLQQPQQMHEGEQFMTPTKQQVRNLKAEQNQALKLTRRSGRKQKKSSITQVPFRKFQQSLEQKIVVLVNRMYQKKINDKELQQFTERVQKMTQKQLYNPYVISGVQTVAYHMYGICLSQRDQMLKMRQQLKRVETRIWEELGRTEDYEEVQVENREVDLGVIRPRLVRKVYRMIVDSGVFGMEEARERSLRVVEGFLSEGSYFQDENLLAFFKQQKYLTC